MDRPCQSRGEGALVMSRFEEVPLEVGNCRFLSLSHLKSQCWLRTMTVCRLASRVLTDEGYLILVAGDGQQALEASRAHLGPLHLVLSDVKMPRLTGPELGGDFEYADVQPIRRVSGYCGIVFRD